MNFRRIAISFLFVSLILGAFPISAQTAEELLPKAIQLEEVKGELEEAIEVYQTIVDRFPANRPIAAKAQLHIGICYEKLGKQAAEKAYKKVIQEFADQEDMVSEARTRLSRIEQPASLAITKGIAVRKIWTGSEVDLMGEPSPDGKYISYVDWVTGNLAIYEINTGRKRHITHRGSWDDPNQFAENSRWSPDSKQIAYAWYNDDNPAFINLYIIGLDGSERRLLYCNEEMDWTICYDWSPDGTKILACFANKDAITHIGLVSTADGSLNMLKTLGYRQWPNNMRFSPDGCFIAYDIPPDKDTRANDIYLISTDGSIETSLVDHPSNDILLDWLPGGNSILFGSERSGAMAFWSIQVAEGKPLGDPKLVKPDMGPISCLGFTEKGSYYYGISQRMNNVYNAKLHPETGEVLPPAQKAIQQFEGYNQAPSYSPDGKYLAYISRRPPMINRQINSRGGNALCIKSLETGEEREIRPSFDLIGYPTWSPDGKSIVVVHWNVNDQIELCQIDVQTEKASLVSRPHENQSHFGGHKWSPDGNTFYFGLKNGNPLSYNIIARDLESGREKIIYKSSDTFYTFSISPDGKWFALMCLGRKGIHIEIVSTNGETSRELFRFAPGIEIGRVPSSTWTSDGKYILFGMCETEVDDEIYELCRIPVSGGEPEKLGLKMKDVFLNLSAHPNGQEITFSSLETSTEIWVMENLVKELEALNNK